MKHQYVFVFENDAGEFQNQHEILLLYCTRFVGRKVAEVNATFFDLLDCGFATSRSPKLTRFTQVILYLTARQATKFV